MGKDAFIFRFHRRRLVCIQDVWAAIRGHQLCRHFVNQKLANSGATPQASSPFAVEACNFGDNNGEPWVEVGLRRLPNDQITTPIAPCQKA